MWVLFSRHLQYKEALIIKYIIIGNCATCYSGNGAAIENNGEWSLTL